MIYEPSEDSFLLAEQVKKYAKGKNCLDMGSGSGILAERALLSGAKSVLAVDIDKKSVKLLSSKKITAIQSDLFEKVSEKFDLIICNPPYLPQDSREDKESQLITTGGKEGDEFILNFIKQAKSHLEKNGKILLLTSSLTPMKRINSLLKKLNMTKKKLVEQPLFMEKLFVYMIKIAR